jgi:hypothetical protein
MQWWDHGPEQRMETEPDVATVSVGANSSAAER